MKIEYIGQEVECYHRNHRNICFSESSRVSEVLKTSSRPIAHDTKT